ncbi:unnamed protein product [Rhizophagus irregularis]|uniref:Uncharacterized protein n=1 Tax=Rhizophagus irregularis TaxID=588596 RepID=A0A2N1N1A6_9GLOM|nr:hypothetical protein RhiirC2_852009 [Rhizophagus irregularis]CAB4373814.1 unnamed protein product [Rhizophagus irregularis]CAB5368747.1 unnamed protein product [Rhizophagus irregularis]
MVQNKIFFILFFMILLIISVQSVQSPKNATGEYRKYRGVGNREDARKGEDAGHVAHEKRRYKRKSFIKRREFINQLNV